MSETSIRLIDKRAYLHCNYHHNRNVARTLTKAVQRSLLVDSRRRAESSTEEIEACLEPTLGNPDLQGTYTVIKRWYCQASANASNSSQEDMAKVKGYYAALYRKDNPTPPREVSTNPCHALQC